MSWVSISNVNFGEKMLWLCALKRSIFDYVLYKGVARHRIKWQRAYQFLFEQDMELDEGLNFEEVCGLFNWAPEYIRRLITKMGRSDLKKIETTKFRDEFSEFCEGTFIVEVMHFDKTGTSVPFFPPYNYASPIRTQLELKRVPRKDRHVSMISRPGAWRVAA